MPLYKTDAVILRARNLGEADRMFVVFSPLHGKIDVIARGVRRPTSKFGCSLEVFSHVYLMLSEGRNFDIVTQVEVCNPHYSLREDLLRLTCASYFLELVEISVVPGQENVELFAMVLSGLSLLEYHDNLELVLRYIEMRFLDILGLSPMLDRCQKCGKSFPSSPVKFLFSSGGAFCNNCSNQDMTGYFVVSPETLGFLKSLQKAPPDKLGNISPSPRNYAESKYLVRKLLLYHLSKDIKSIKMVDSFMER